MNVLGNDEGRYTIEMTAFEIFVCRGALREVLYGLEFPDFESRMGCTRPEAKEVFDALPRSTGDEVDRTAPPSPARG